MFTPKTSSSTEAETSRRYERQHDTISYQLSGTRAAIVTLAEDLMVLIKQRYPEVIGRMETIISTFPEEWPEHLHDGETGQHAAKRAVLIELPSPFQYSSPDGRIHSVSALQVVGVTFTRENLANQWAHTGHTADFLDPEALIRGDLMKNPSLSPESNARIVALYRKAVIEVWGSEEAYRQELNSITNSVDFDAAGKPIFSKSSGSLRGGHGFETAKRKFEHSRYVLPPRGVRGPLSLGYAEYIGDGFTMEGRKIGAYLSLIRTGEPTRLSDHIEERAIFYCEHFKRETLSAIASLQSEAERSLIREISSADRADLMRSAAELKRKVSLSQNDPKKLLAEWYPIKEHEVAIEAYGRALRRLLGDDLSNTAQMIVPFRFPHTGNLAIDFSEPHPDGGFVETWYDLGGWKFGSEMTREQAFSYAYYTFESGLSYVIKSFLSSDSPLGVLKDQGKIDPVGSYLRGFFFDRLRDPEFRRWEVQIFDGPNGEGSGTNVEMTFKQHLRKPSLPAPHQRTAMPYVTLFRKMMKFDPDTTPQMVSAKDVEALCSRSLAKSITSQRGFTRSRAEIYGALAALAQEGGVAASQVAEVFRRFRLPSSRSEAEIASALNAAGRRALLGGRKHLGEIELVEGRGDDLLSADHREKVERLIKILEGKFSSEPRDASFEERGLLR